MNRPKVVITTGTTPAPYRGFNADGETVIDSDDILSLKEVPRTMTVVGAGVVGIEYASIFAALGSEVTVVERRDEILDFVEAVGLTADERGRIPVDEHYQTARSHIYAVGDVVGFPSLASTSMEQGRIAACHAFGIEYQSSPDHFPFGIYSVPELSMVGETEHDLTAAGVPYEVGLARYREIARGNILGDDTGMLKLLGVHIIGAEASELVHIGQAVLAFGGTLDYFVNTVFNYPTLAECYKVAALDCYNKIGLSDEDL